MVTATAAPPSEFQARVVGAQDGDLGTYAYAVHQRTYHQYQDVWGVALETYNETVIVCPPDTYKSTTVRDYVEREIGKNPNIRILWLMNAGAQSTKQIQAIQQTLEFNNVYKAAYNVCEDPRAQWTKEVLYVIRTREGADPTLMGTGMNGPYQGLHFDIIIIDDPTEQEDPHSPTTMEMQRNKVRGVIDDRLVEGGRIVVILTRWGDNDLVPTFADMGFTIIEMPIVGNYPWGPTLDPVRFTEAWVERKRVKKGDILFALTFMCSAEAATGNLILREHIHYWEDKDIPEAPMHFFMGVDPAASLKTYADRAAIATVGLDLKSRDLFLVDLWAGRLETPDLETYIVKLANRTAGMRQIGIETAGFQLSFMQRMRREYSLDFREIPYRTRRTTMRGIVGIERDKVGRAIWLDSMLASKKLRLRRGLPLVDGVSFESELCTIPHGKMDDRMDATCFATILAEAAAPVSLKVRLRGF
ncbi:hypothetical protein LCGC14_0872860 [marine sediment metagenome]|uniref:Terminase large subunit gp17-like C-terminal domain-containing protein n=1 Tax=marine sediment metagenome TaxID=412755 RepID=A0A0F9PPS3_9ZZZZ